LASLLAVPCYANDTIEQAEKRKEQAGTGQQRYMSPELLPNGASLWCFNCSSNG